MASDRTSQRSRRLLAGVPVLLLFVAVVAEGPASAQIYKWEDGNGVSHFTNSLDSVPDAAREAAAVFVEKSAMSYADSEVPMSKENSPPAGVSSEEEKDLLRLVETAGQRPSRGSEWRQGFAAGREEGRVVPPLQPPVLVIERPEFVFPPIQTYDPTGLYYDSRYRGTVTVPFDRGRSMGLTRRMQIQERIQTERERR